MRPADFTPAEALYLLCGEKIALRSLLKATVLDLVRREVLQVSLEPHTEDFHMAKVSAGAKIGDFQPLPFEAPFVARFRQVPDWKPDLKFYVMDLERKPYASVVKFMAAVHRDPRIRPYIITQFFLTLIGGYRANRAGENMVHEIRKLLTEGLDLLARGHTGEARERLGGLAVLTDLPEVYPLIQGPHAGMARELTRNHAGTLTPAWGVPLVMTAAGMGQYSGDIFGLFDEALQTRRPPRPVSGEDAENTFAGSDSGESGGWEDDDSDGAGSDGDGDGGGSDGGGDSGCSGCGGCGGGD